MPADLDPIQEEPKTSRSSFKFTDHLKTIGVVLVFVVVSVLIRVVAKWPSGPDQSAAGDSAAERYRQTMLRQNRGDDPTDSNDLLRWRQERVDAAEKFAEHAVKRYLDEESLQTQSRPRITTWLDNFLAHFIQSSSTGSRLEGGNGRWRYVNTQTVFKLKIPRLGAAALSKDPDHHLHRGLVPVLEVELRPRDIHEPLA